MRFLLLFLIALVLLPCVFASEYEIFYDFSNEHNATKFGNVEVIDIIFNKNLINKNTTILNFSIQNILQYDSVTVGSNAVTIDGAIYSPGAIKYYDIEGIHTYCEVSNSSKCSSFNVNKLADPVVDISVTSKELDFVIDKPNIVIDTEKIVKIYINVTNDLTPRTYLYRININNDTIERLFDIKEIEQWNVTSYKFLNVLDTGEHGIFGNITLKSTGNVYSIVDISLDGNDTMLFIDDDVLLYPDTPITVEVLYDISMGRSVGEYKNNIRFDDIAIPINFSIRDSVVPELTEFSFFDVRIYNKTGFSFKATDNLRINESYIEYLNVQDASVTKTIVNKFENNMFIDDKTVFDILGDYTAQGCVNDDSGNLNCTEKQFFKVIKTDRVILPGKTVHFKRVKFENYVYAPIFNLTEDMSVRIKVNTIEYTNSTEDWTIKVIDGDGTTEYFIDSIGSEIVVSKAGVIKIGFKGNKEGIYNGIVSIIPAWFNNNVSDVTLSGEIVDYKVPESFTRDWYGNELSCDVVSTDDIDTSFYDCKIKFSILSDLENTAIPITVTDKEANAVSWEERIKVWKDKNSAKIGVIITFIILLFISLLFVLWYSMFAGRVYFKFK